MGCVFSQLAAKFAFFPPSPPSYQIKKSEEGKLTAVSNSSSLPFPASDSGDDSLDVLLINTKRGNKIVGFFFKNPYARLTVLYSHGNAADLGQLYDLFVQLKVNLRVNLRVNLMAYDYSGYGASTGKPSEYDTYADIEAVYECLQTEYGISQEDLILYGQSVGSGPTLHLAAKLPRLRGVVLHSGILSGLRVLCHADFAFCVDIYLNINKIKKVKCPVLVIHGTKDDVVNWLHGKGLWKMAREPYEPLWIQGGGHCNLEIYADYISHLHRFIQDMEKITTKTRLKKIRENLGLQDRSNRCCRTGFCTKQKCGSWCSCWRPSCSDGCSGIPKCVKFQKCPPCAKPKCSCWMPSCSDCCSCLPGCWKSLKCPPCTEPNCGRMCSCFTLGCFGSCWKPGCSNCCSCIPKCLKCLKCPACTKPKCGKMCSCCAPSCSNCCSCSCIPNCLKCPKCPSCTDLKCGSICSCCSPGCFGSCWKPSCSNCLKCLKCPACTKPKCGKMCSCCAPSCSNSCSCSCIPNCLKCPKCPSCTDLKCGSICSCCSPGCFGSCWKPSCSNCLKCPKCPCRRPECPKCSDCEEPGSCCCFGCFRSCCCGGENQKGKETREG